MDPVTLLVTALVTGAAEALKPTVGQAIKEAYAGLKNVIIKKLGGQPNADDVQSAIKGVEKKPEDAARKEVLADEVKAANVTNDSEVVAAMQKLLAALKDAGVGTNISASNGGVVNTGSVGGSIITGEVNTGGGPLIGGDVSTGRDFVGRDVNNTVVHNYGGATPSMESIVSESGRKLVSLLNQHFNISEIDSLCFEMGIDEEQLRSQTKDEKVRSLVKYCEQAGRTDALKRLMRLVRPNLRPQLS